MQTEKTPLTALILASALITLDGTAVTVSLPAIGRELAWSVSRLQWISNASLLMLAALLVPSGAAADRLGRYRALRIGLLLFAAGSLGGVLSPSGAWLIGARAAQGVGGALILPAALAALRAGFPDPLDRTRIFGVWAAWTGVAGAAGPLLGGAIVDLVSWRGVLAMSCVVAVATLALLGIRSSERAVVEPRQGPIPLVPAVRELVRSHNCLPANGATFAFYFGMFGLSFLLVLYTQQVLGYSGTWAGVVLLPISVMLFGAGLLGRVTARFGSRLVLTTAAGIAASGVLWLATGAHPLSFTTRLIPAMLLFGLGISVGVAPLTQAAVSAVPEHCAGSASGLNHATVRAAGLIAIAVLGAVAAPGSSQSVSPEGVRTALLVCAAVVGLVGVASGALVRDDRPGGLRKAA
jgi:MFS family permease